VIVGLCAKRLKAGVAKVFDAVVAVAEARVVKNRRRVIARPVRKCPDIK
jgi:hypothetical protein